jgi:hypothetical protein
MAGAMNTTLSAGTVELRVSILLLLVAWWAPVQQNYIQFPVSKFKLKCSSILHFAICFPVH